MFEASFLAHYFFFFSLPFASLAFLYFSFHQNKMVCNHSFMFCQRPCYISLVFLLILSTTQVRFKAEGRPNPKSDSFSKAVNEEKAILRAQIGSRPPRCERRCSSCGHCEAIQVPTNPQVRNQNRNSSTLISDVAYARDGSSNYKPMSWKCKCGNFIFNP